MSAIALPAAGRRPRICQERPPLLMYPYVTDVPPYVEVQAAASGSWASDGYIAASQSLPKAVCNPLSVFLCCCLEQLYGQVRGRQICALVGLLDNWVFQARVQRRTTPRA